MKLLFPAMALACIAAVATPATAQQRQNQQQQQRQQQQQKQQIKQQQIRADLSPKQVTGQLVSYRTAQLQGQRQPHVLAKIRTDQGNIIVADLGPASNLQRQNVQLRRGQQIQATGRTGRINDMPILVVDRSLLDNQFTVIGFERISRQRDQQRMAQAHQQRQGAPQQFGFDQQDQRQRQQMQRQGRQLTPQQRAHIQRMRGVDADRQPDPLKQVMVTGRLVDVRGAQMQGIPDTHRLAKIRTMQGQTIVVDLGTSRDLRDLTLQRNELVSVVGTKGRINGRPVIFANYVADVERIDRQQQQQRQQRQNRTGAQRQQQ